MAKKADRGTKRTCQNSSCGARFYDLNRDPIVCPICSEIYQLAVGPAPGPPADDAAQRRAPKKPEYTADAAPGELPETEADDALADVEAGDEPIEAADDETFLEEEEEGGDMTGIIGGSTPEGEEEN
jgi:uncharacterized protein (TIGR02300 family)